MDTETLVYVDLAGAAHLAGRLWARVRRNKEGATFEYDGGWLQWRWSTPSPTTVTRLVIAPPTSADPVRSPVLSSDGRFIVYTAPRLPPSTTRTAVMASNPYSTSRTAPGTTHGPPARDCCHTT